MIEVESLRKEFDVPTGTLVAVNDIDLTIDDDEFVTLVGPSGCGKTTTLRSIAGLETPTSGEIRFDGREVTEVPANRRGLAMMFQNIALYPHMTVRQNISYPLKVKGKSKEFRDERAEEAAEIMQIPELLDKHPAELSGGQRQRAALARTIVQEPEAFLMDEPLSDLDAKLKVEIRKEIQRVHQRVGRPTLYVTHDQEEAMTMSDRIAVMNGGDIEQVGTPDQLYTRPNNTFVARFIGNPSMNFFEGELESIDQDMATVKANGAVIEIPTAGTENSTNNTDIMIGVRPEDLRLNRNDGGYFDGEVTLVERTGDRMQATLDGPGEELRAMVSADTSLTAGQTAPVWFDGGDAHIFDIETGDVIAHGERTG